MYAGCPLVDFVGLRLENSCALFHFRLFRLLFFVLTLHENWITLLSTVPLLRSGHFLFTELTSLAVKSAKRPRKPLFLPAFFHGLILLIRVSGVRAPDGVPISPAVRGMFVYYRGLRILCAVGRKQGALSRAFRTECERHKAT